MNENLILIAANKIKDQSLTSQEASEKILEISNDSEYMLQWCFSMLHRFSSFDSRAFALDTIQNSINDNFESVSLNSIDHLLYEFFLSIYKDSDYNNVTLLNKISGIQARLIKHLFPIEWPTAFEPLEEFSVMNFPDTIFFNFLISLRQVAQTDSNIVKLMQQDGFSLKNLLSRISDTVIKGSSDAKNIFLNCFDWIDFHILVSLPCFLFILDDFNKVPNPKTAISILSTIFKQEKFSKEEKAKFISDFKLFERFNQYLNTFSTISVSSLNDFTILLCNIFGPLIKNEFITTFIPLFIITLNRLLQAKNYQISSFKRFNGLFHEMVFNQIIQFQQIKEAYYPILIGSLNSPEAECDSNIPLLFDFFFSNIVQKADLINEIHAFLSGLTQEAPNQDNKPIQQSKYYKIFLLLNNFSIYAHNSQTYTKIVLREVLAFFSPLLDIEPSKELINDPYYIKSLKAFSDLFLQSKAYFDSKSFEKIREKDSLLFYRQFQCTFQGVHAFMNSMLSLCQLENSSIVRITNINDIVSFLITSLNIDMFKIALALIEKAPDEAISTIKNKSTEIILDQDPTLFSISEIRMLFMLFSFKQYDKENENKDKDKNKSKKEKEKEKKQKEKKPTSFLSVSYDSKRHFNFFSRVYLNSNDQNGNLIPSNKFESNNDYYEYAEMMTFLFGYKAFPFYFNEIFNNPRNQNISVIASIISILFTRYRPNISVPLTPEVEQTNGFLVFFAQNSLGNLFNIIDRDRKENKCEASQELKDFSFFYSQFIKYIIYFTSIASNEVISQILSIAQQLFRFPVLSNEALEIFLKFAFSKNDAHLIELIYPTTVNLLVQLLSKSPIFPVDYKQCVIVTLTFHHEVFQKDVDFGRSIIAPAYDLIGNTKLKFHVYVNLLEASEDQFCTRLGRISNEFFPKNE